MGIGGSGARDSAKRDFISKTSSGKFQVKSKAGKVLGTHKTRGEALQQLRAVEYAKANEDARAGSLSNISSPLQPHELPERHSNPQHGADPLVGVGEPGNRSYLQVAGPEGEPAVDASGAPGGTEVDPSQLNPVPLENLATERAEESAGLHEAHGASHPPGLLGDDAPGQVPQEETRAPFQPGGNGDPAPNPSKQRTIMVGGEAMNAAQPDEQGQIDEGDPNQYEMLSTSARLSPSEGNEPGYAESPSSGPDDRKQGWKDPAGDNDFLVAINAFPNYGGSEL